jgi:tetratricopeptide (TPR) repeat protein
LATERCDQGHWRAAALLYDRVIAQGPIPYEVWTESAIAHLSIDDEAGYRSVCEVMRSRHPAAIPELFVRPQLASVCALAPGAVGDDGKAMGWMETLLAELPPDHKLRHAYLKTSGSILYRSGQYRAAIDRINEGIATANGAPVLENFLAPIFLAMAYHKAGDHAKARELLAKLRPANLASSLDLDAGRIFHLLRREAERLILDPDFPADPFAP